MRVGWTNGRIEKGRGRRGGLVEYYHGWQPSRTRKGRFAPGPPIKRMPCLF